MPIQELSDWFEHWAIKGVKPVFPCRNDIMYGSFGVAGKGNRPMSVDTPDLCPAHVTSAEQERFDRLAAEWKKDTFLLSKISGKVSHIAYQKIIGMGSAAVPCILNDLRDNGPNHWFWALHAITEENPVPTDKVGNITAMTEAWLQWGRQKRKIVAKK